MTILKRNSSEDQQNSSVLQLKEKVANELVGAFINAHPTIVRDPNDMPSCKTIWGKLLKLKEKKVDGNISKFLIHSNTPDSVDSMDSIPPLESEMQDMSPISDNCSSFVFFWSCSCRVQIKKSISKNGENPQAIET